MTDPDPLDDLCDDQDAGLIVALALAVPLLFFASLGVILALCAMGVPFNSAVAMTVFGGIAIGGAAMAWEGRS